jgi:serine phosphatase RsbU (regulator of sigma subunit)
MKKFILAVINSGINKSTKDDEAEKIRYLNGISLLGLPLCVFYTVLFFITGYNLQAWSFSVGIPIFLSSIFTTRYIGLRPSRIISATMAPLFFAFNTVLLGEKAGLYMGFLVITIPPWLFYYHFRKSGLLVFFSVICLVSAFIAMHYINPPDELPYARYIFFFNLSIAMLIEFAMIIFFKNEILNNRRVLKEKNKEIMDSISYAKRIQEAIFPTDNIIKTYFPDSFILYRPKDIVAGDFFWLDKTDDNIIFAVADCTGHGVPGALVSVVCNNALNRTVHEFKISQPSLILDNIRVLVKKTFERSEEEVKDGMDIALCSYDQKTNLFQFSGAFNSIYIIRSDNMLEEIKGDKMPIGIHVKEDSYINHIININKGDSIYLMSDGYQDQFGGPKKKKFLSKQLKELLLSIHTNPMPEQKEILNLSFENWKGENKQTDDVTIFGMRI